MQNEQNNDILQFLVEINENISRMKQGLNTNFTANTSHIKHDVNESIIQMKQVSTTNIGNLDTKLGSGLDTQ